MNLEPLAIPEVKLLRPRRFDDNRGFFREVWNRERWRGLGIDGDWVQDNQSLSWAAGTIRGLHFQIPPVAQAKLVRCGRGRVWDVAVDLRPGPGFGRWAAAVLTAEGGEQLFIPKGFAHGFCTLEPECELLYKVDAPYSPAHERGILWRDTVLAIDWPLAGQTPVLSDKDVALPGFDAVEAWFAAGEGR